MIHLKKIGRFKMPGVMNAIKFCRKKANGEFPRHQEAAHYSKKYFKKIELLKKAFIIRMKGKEYSSYPIIIGAIAEYVEKTLRDMVNNINNRN